MYCFSSSMLLIWHVGLLQTTYVNIMVVNTLRPRQNGRHFADGIFKCIFKNEKSYILIRISLNFIPKGRIVNSLTE